jgi:hypothetical protein
MAPIVNKLAPSDVFRTYCIAGDDRKPLVLDLRPNKEFKKGHLQLAFNVVLSKNGRILAVCTYREQPWVTCRIAMKLCRGLRRVPWFACLHPVSKCTP